MFINDIQSFLDNKLRLLSLNIKHPFKYKKQFIPR